MSKNYTASTAKIIADNGETMKADIMQTGDDYAQKLRTIRADLRNDYWQLHNEMGSEAKEVPAGEATAAVAKLGQLALALEAVEKAYSAVNSVRCF